MTASSVSVPASDYLRTLVAGRTVVLATAHLTAGGSILQQLRELGAGHILVLGPPAFRRLTTTAGAELIMVDIGDEDPAITRQRWESLLADPPPVLANLLDARDPDRSALVLVSPWFTTDELLGRPVFGAHRPSRASFEHKLLVDWLWDNAGMPTEPAHTNQH